ncbi:hypothetical protein CVT26_011533 [Gymnopilus dilepis]|uniref:Uncharacterized protein n=1 Tax=Gymnopilus dilepis TaxID=231916 RepID=A0A409WNK9_9AGAR|nr:hypothetical protein CVT26_011533 [Gymnopilus dilepis]
MAQTKGAIGIDAVTLVSIFVEAVLYGLFIVLFIASTSILLGKFRRSKSSALNTPMLVASIVMFILSTVHIGTDLRRLLNAFLRSADQGGPVPYLSKVNDPIYVLKSTAYAMQTLVGDAFIVSCLNNIF